MPTVPSYGGRRVRQASLPGARVAPSAPEGAFGTGPASSAVFSEVQKTAGEVERVKQRADQLAVMEADLKLTSVEDLLLHDPKSGAFTRRGKDALGLPEQVLGAFSQEAEKIEQGLSGDGQRQAFRRMRMMREAGIQSTLRKYMREEVRRFDEETTNAYMAAAFDEGVKNFRDPERVQLSIERQKRAWLDHAGYLGHGKEWVQLKTSEAASRTHAAVIGRFLDSGEDLAAEAYFKANEAQLTGADSAKIEGALREGSRRGQSQRITDEIMQGKPQPVTRFDPASGSATVELQMQGAAKTLEEGLERARQVADPEVRDMVVARVKQRFAEIQHAKEVQSEGAFEEAAKLVDDAIASKMGPSAMPGFNLHKFVNPRDAVPPQLWERLSAKHRTAIERRAQDFDSEEQAEAEISAMIADGSLQRVTLPAFEARFFHRLSRKDRDHYRDVWVSGQKALTKAEGAEKFNSLFQDDELIRHALSDAKLGGITSSDTAQTISKDETKSMVFARFKREVDSILSAFHLATGKNADDRQKQAAIDQVLKRDLKEFFVPGFWTNVKKRSVELTPEDRARAFDVNVPQPSVDAIKGQLVARGWVFKQGDEGRIRGLAERIYAAAYLGDRDRVERILSGQE